MAQNPFAPSLESLADYREITRHVTDTRMLKNNVKKVYCFVGWTKAEYSARVGWPQTSSSPPVIFIAGRPKAALLIWFFSDFRCGALLFIVIHVIYKYKNR